MGRKERNPIKRIEQATRASKRKYTSSLQDLARESIPGEWITEIIEYPATVPVGAEFELLQDVLASSDNVFYKPRRRREYQIDSSQLREGANKQVISSQADSLIKISRIWADFFPANTSNQPI
ncbi:hypothetical protein HV061_19840 [Enterobacter hormaechei]|nr:hypothetical protein [Enterobacter hormaechei]QLP78782.1 hypothetical protein HV061_19840 [Enterobacter hormaechei]